MSSALPEFLDDHAAPLDFTAEVTLSTPWSRSSTASLVHIHFLVVSPPLASLVALCLAKALFPSSTPLSDFHSSLVSVCSIFVCGVFGHQLSIMGRDRQRFDVLDAPAQQGAHAGRGRSRLHVHMSCTCGTDSCDELEYASTSLRKRRRIPPVPPISRLSTIRGA